MDAPNLRVREQHRDLLRAAGFPFCDDSAQELDPELKHAGVGVALSEAARGPAGVQNLLRNEVTASSCDHDVLQSIGMKPCC